MLRPSPNHGTQRLPNDDDDDDDEFHLFVWICGGLTLNHDAQVG